MEPGDKTKKLLKEREVIGEMGLDYGDYDGDVFEDMKKTIDLYKAHNGITTRPEVPNIIRQNEEMKKLGKPKKLTKNKLESLSSSVSSLKSSSSPHKISSFGSESNSLNKIMKILKTHRHILEDILRLVTVGTNKQNTTKKEK